MNHASISPDGKLLLAVGDRHTAFFCQRVRLPSASGDGITSYATYEWHEIARLKLSLVESKDACFSTAFSPSGRTYIFSIAYPNLAERDVTDAISIYFELSRNSDVLLKKLC